MKPPISADLYQATAYHKQWALPVLHFFLSVVHCWSLWLAVLGKQNLAPMPRPRPAALPLLWRPLPPFLRPPPPMCFVQVPRIIPAPSCRFPAGILHVATNLTEDKEPQPSRSHFAHAWQPREPQLSFRAYSPQRPLDVLPPEVTLGLAAVTHVLTLVREALPNLVREMMVMISPCFWSRSRDSCKH